MIFGKFREDIYFQIKNSISNGKIEHINKKTMNKNTKHKKFWVKLKT